MNTNLFRTGNWVYVGYSGTFEKIRGIIDKDVNLFFDAGHYHGLLFNYASVGNKLIEPDNCEPILLTADILEKSGFEVKKNGSPQRWHKLGQFNFKFYKWKTENQIHMSNLNGFGNRIRHVHQLQNLYFALTGEELTINF